MSLTDIDPRRSQCCVGLVRFEERNRGRQAAETGHPDLERRFGRDL